MIEVMVVKKLGIWNSNLLIMKTTNFFATFSQQWTHFVVVVVVLSIFIIQKMNLHRSSLEHDEPGAEPVARIILRCLKFCGLEHKPWHNNRFMHWLSY